MRDTLDLLLITPTRHLLNIIFGGQGAQLLSLLINFSFLKKDHKTCQSTAGESCPLERKVQ